jgi:uracil-DNA glycosylase
MDEDALRALMLQIEWGADEALEDAPQDRLSAAPAPAKVHHQLPPTPRPVSGRGALERAEQAAAAADTLEALRAAIAGFDGCTLRDTATGPVLFEGDPISGLLLVSGPPGAEDDRAQRLFAGPDGTLLDAMLASIGLARASFLAVPLIPWRPPGGRPPSQSEMALCLPFLHRLIVLARPRLAVLLGTLPARALLGPERRGRGQLVQTSIPGLDELLSCFAVSSPDQLLHAHDRRAAAWAELRRLRRALDARHA